MAIYHLHVSTGSKAGGQSAIAKADYIERNGKYEKGKEEVEHSESGNMPEWSEDNNKLYWQSADEYERANGRLFTEVEFSLPIELSKEQQLELVREFAQHITADENLPYTFAIHKGEYDHQGRKTDTPANPHCHLVISERKNDGIERNHEQWFKRANKKHPERGGAVKTETLKTRDWLCQTREEWQKFANEALEKAGHQERIDHRTLEAQGIDREPQMHRGATAQMAKRGIITERHEQANAIDSINAIKTEQTQALKSVNTLSNNLAELDKIEAGINGILEVFEQLSMTEKDRQQQAEFCWQKAEEAKNQGKKIDWKKLKNNVLKFIQEPLQTAESQYHELNSMQMLDKYETLQKTHEQTRSRIHDIPYQIDDINKKIDNNVQWVKELDKKINKLESGFFSRLTNKKEIKQLYIEKERHKKSISTDKKEITNKAEELESCKTRLESLRSDLNTLGTLVRKACEKERETRLRGFKGAELANWRAIEARIKPEKDEARYQTTVNRAFNRFLKEPTNPQQRTRNLDRER